MRLLLLCISLILLAPDTGNTAPVDQEPVAARDASKKEKKKKKKKKKSAAMTAADAPAETVAPPKGGYVFAWPHDARVRVTERVQKDGDDITQTYLISLESRPDGNLTVGYSDFSFVSIKGVEMTEEVRAELAPVAALTGAIPEMVITPEGRFVSIDGIDAMIDEVLPFLATTEELDQAALERTATMLRSPEMRTLFVSTATAIWNSWAGDWVTLKLKSEERYDGDVKGISGNPQGISLENLGPSTEHPGKVQLRYTAVMGTAATAERMGPLLRSMIQTMSGTKGEKEYEEVLADLEASITRTVDTVTDPVTLQPVTVSTRKVVDIKIEVASIEERIVEIHDYAFDWSVE
jgi:hypothetical protein